MWYVYDGEKIFKLTLGKLPSNINLSQSPTKFGGGSPPDVADAQSWNSAGRAKPGRAKPGRARSEPAEPGAPGGWNPRFLGCGRITPKERLSLKQQFS